MKATMTEESAGERLQRLQRERTLRAAQEGEAYEITYHAPIGKWLVRNPASGKSYFVTKDCCECGDWTYRCCASGLKCKHQVAVSLHRLFQGEEATR